MCECEWKAKAEPKIASLAPGCIFIISKCLNKLQNVKRTKHSQAKAHAVIEEREIHIRELEKVVCGKTVNKNCKLYSAGKYYKYQVSHLQV